MQKKINYMYVFECVIWDSQHTQTLVSLWGLRDVDGELAAERVNSHHARVTAGAWQRGQLVMAPWHAVQRLRQVCSTL